VLWGGKRGSGEFSSREKENQDIMPGCRTLTLCTCPEREISGPPRGVHLSSDRGVESLGGSFGLELTGPQNQDFN